MQAIPLHIQDFFSSARWFQTLIVVAGLFLACFGVQALLQGDQPYVTTLLAAGILALPAVVTNPRWGLLFLLWTLHTIDGFKRLIYSATNFTQAEVAQILIIPVLIAAALYVRVFLMAWFGQYIVLRVNLIRFWPITLAMTGITIAILRDEISYSALVKSYPFICYIPAGIIVPHIIYNTERRLQFTRTLLWIALVVGVYGLVQAVHGPFAYEVGYLYSGLTTTISSIEGVAFFRGFSLLNSSSAFCGAVIMATFFSFFYFCYREGRFRFKRPVVLMCLFAASICIAATQRGPLLAFVLTLLVLPLFKRPKAFFAACAVGLVLFAGLIYFADELLLKLRIVNDTLLDQAESGFAVQSLNLLTYAQRLNGFSALANPELWTPFGASTVGESKVVANDVAFGHDLISNFLEWFGYIGTGAFLLTAGILLYLAVHRLRSLLHSPERSLWAQCNLAIFVFMMIWQLLAGTAIHVSPLNFYFWVAIGNLLYLLTEPMTVEASDERPERAERIRWPHAGIPPEVAGRRS